MSALTATAALLCTVLALVCAGAVLARTRSVAQALPVLLELFLAAGLLRLAHDPSWRAIAGAAALVGLRKLVVAYGLRPAQRSAA